MKLASPILLTLLVLGYAKADILPEDVPQSSYRTLQSQSPFTRSLNMPSKLVLTGVANLNGSNIATVIDAETGDSSFITEQENDTGMKLVKVSDPENLDQTIITISKGSGNEFRIAYDKKLHQEIAAKYRKRKPTPKSSGDKKPKKELSDEQKKKYSKIKDRWKTLNKEQQDKARKLIGEKFKNSRDMTSEQRSAVYNDVLNQVTGNK